MATPRARLRELLPDARALAALGLARALASWVAWGAGFRALSDDDYARLAIAQRFAHAPRLDPSGTSWLPAPFWAYGAAFRCFGTDLAVARGSAALLGILATVLLYVAGRVLGAPRGAAMLGSLLATFVPYSALLGIAAVPEVPCAALIVFGAATLARADPRLRVAGGACLALACLSRYEAWPVACVFALFGAWDALRNRRALLILGTLIALLGPAIWLSVGHFSHGDALFFVARVTAYRRALGGSEGSLLQRLLQYPAHLLLAEPTSTLAFAGSWLVGRKLVPNALAPFRRGTWALLALLGFLMLGSVRDGVPTHHAARVLLPIWFFVALALGRLLAVLAHGKRLPARAFGGVLLFGALLASIVERARTGNGESFANRGPELAAGQEAKRRGVPTLAIETSDYGYFAVQAGYGDPARTWVLDEHDPRRPRPALGPDEVHGALSERGMHSLVVTVDRAAQLGTRCLGLWERTPLVLLDCGRAPGASAFDRQ